MSAGMYLFSPWLLRHYSPAFLLLISFIFEVLHMSAYPLLGIIGQPWGALAIESIQCVTYAVFVPAGPKFMESRAPSPHLIASMQALSFLTIFSIGMNWWIYLVLFIKYPCFNFSVSIESFGELNILRSDFASHPQLGDAMDGQSG